ncbi:MAG: NAD-dependent epimerase/dehydratase family protein [Granulosicoccus sp.]
MAALVTGASGLLGHAVAHRLAAQGEVVRVLIRKAEQSVLFRNTAIQCVVGALENIESLVPAVDGVSEIYHCAATSTDWAPWETYYSGNVTGVRNLLEAASREKSLQRFLHVSTMDVYGYPKSSDDDENLLLVDAGLPYNQTKIAGEQLVWEASARGMPVTVVRPGTIYGPRDKNFVGMIYDHLKGGDMPLVSGGESSPGLIYITNLVDGMIAAACSAKTIGKAYNMRDETSESWRDYLNAFADIAGINRTRLVMPFPLAYGFAWACEKFNLVRRSAQRPLLTRHAVLLFSRDAAFPIDRAINDFGFRSTVSFDEGVSNSVAWVQREQNSSAVTPATA